MLKSCYHLTIHLFCRMNINDLRKFKMKKIAYNITYLLFILAFFKGTLELIGINETYLQLLIDILIISIFLISLIFMVERKDIIVLGSKISIIFFLFIMVSFLLTDITSLHLILFLRKFYIYILFLYTLINIGFEEEEKEHLLKLLMILFLIQIPASFIKLIVLGGTLEAIIGTMSVAEGSLATVMPLFGISYAISLYLNHNRIKYIILILLFMSIGLISNKLGILFYIFILFTSLTLLYAKKKTNSFFFNIAFLKNISKIIIYLLIIFALFVSLNPRANPEHKVGGSIDIDYLIKFTQEYNSLKLKGSKVQGDGRGDAPLLAFKRLENGGLMNILIGYGPGDIVSSSFLPYENPLLEKYNIGYGGRLGMVWMMMQLGLIGIMIFIIFQIFLFVQVYKKYSKVTREEDVVKILSILGIIIVFFIDFFTYSSQLLYSSGITIAYYFLIYYVITYQNKKEN